MPGFTVAQDVCQDAISFQVSFNKLVVVWKVLCQLEWLFRLMQIFSEMPDFSLVTGVLAAPA